MDSELFTVGGANTNMFTTKPLSSQGATNDQLNYQKARTLQAYRSVGKTLYWFIMIATLFMIVMMIPLAMKAVSEIKTKSNFSQKEGLQYLGASTNVTRDDTGWPGTDSLAESAWKAQEAATNMAAAPATKATFVVPRESMTAKLTPEEELMKQQGARK